MPLADEVKFFLLDMPAASSAGGAVAERQAEGFPGAGSARSCAVAWRGSRGRRLAAGAVALLGLAALAALAAGTGSQRLAAGASLGDGRAATRAGLVRMVATGAGAGKKGCNQARRLAKARRLSNAKDCQKPKEGDECYDMVKFVTTKGIALQPSLYGGLTLDSSLREVQNKVNEMFPKVCAPACFNSEAKHLGSKDELESELEALGLQDDKDEDDCDDDDEEGASKVSEKSDRNCHTAVPGEECYVAVIYVATDGIIQRPRTFHGLNMATSLHDIQMFLHENPDALPDSKCGKPCNEKCHDAIEGEPCHTNVKWAMTEGINSDNGTLWFPGLTNKSSFAEFQMSISGDNDATVDCPRPCKKFCRTSSAGEKCFEAVDWVMKIGVRKQPESYKGISIYSSFEEVQRHLFNNKSESASMCPEPCAPHVPDAAPVDAEIAMRRAQD